MTHHRDRPGSREADDGPAPPGPSQPPAAPRADPPDAEAAQPPPPGPARPPPPPLATAPSTPPSRTDHTGITFGPTAGREREPILDLLRGFALLGILLINIELMRGPGLYDVLAGRAPDPGSTLDRTLSFLSGWLAGGKFISSFAILFGIGAAFLVARAERSGVSPHRLLARRYAALVLIGLAHMLLLFPGDILFAYGLTGFVLLVFARVTPRVAAWWSAGILAALGVLAAGIAALSLATGGSAAGAEMGAAWFGDRRDTAIAAYTDGSTLDVLRVHAFESLLVQSGHVASVPWLLGLFLLGFALGRAGVVTALARHRRRLRLAAVVGLGVGLPLNLPAGVAGPLGVSAAGGSGTAATAEALTTLVQFVAAPILAVGYLSVIALLALRLGTWWPLAAVGRMALTAYLLQSVVGLVVFVGLGWYGQLAPAPALLVVLVTWALLLVVSPLWLSRFRFGPVEQLWRWWTYRRLGTAREPQEHTDETPSTR